jgi:hypothetical protein
MKTGYKASINEVTTYVDTRCPSYVSDNDTHGMIFLDDDIAEPLIGDMVHIEVTDKNGFIRYMNGHLTSIICGE